MEASETVAADGTIITLIIICLVISLFMLVAKWKVFTKAGQPGIGCIVPIYDLYLMLKIAGKPGWWLWLMFIPFANFVVAILMMIGLSENFGKGGGFTVGLILLPFIFFPMLAFGSAEYAPVEAPADE